MCRCPTPAQLPSLRAEKELLLVEGARHIQSYLLGGDQYREKLARFFEKYDCEEGGKQ